MDSFTEDPKSLLNRILFLLKAAACIGGGYIAIAFVLSVTAFFSSFNGNAEVEYWGPIHWPLKLFEKLFQFL